MSIRFYAFLTMVWIGVDCFAQSPQASFMTIPSFENGAITVCSGEPIGFINTSLNVGPLASYEWDFGFGASPSTYSLEGPVSVTYSSVTPATTASLTVNNNDGSSPSTFTITVSVNESPTSDLHLVPEDLEF